MTIFQSPFPDVPLRDQTITERVLDGLSPRGDAVVLTDGPTGQTVTAAALIQQIKRLAGGLNARGTGAGTTIALMSPNIPTYATIFHGIAYAGGTITTINPTYTAPEVTHQLNDSGATILITVEMFADTAREAAVGTAVDEIVIIGTPAFEALFGAPQAAQTPVELDQHTVVLPYSSGTTGLSKGVMLSHRNLVVNIDQILGTIVIEPDDAIAGFLPFFHIYGMMVGLNCYLARGAHVVTMPRFDLPMFLQLAQDHQTSRMWVVPPVGIALAKHPLVDDYDLSAVKEVYIAAAPSGSELTNAIAARMNCTVLQAYGMTELSPASHLVPGTAPRAGAAGLLVPNTQARIVDIESGHNCAADQEGELWLKGPQVMQGYLNNPTATAETIVTDGWLRTGDIARIDPDGYMFITDRLKELIKFKGFQVAPAELEATLVALDGITDAGVVGRADDDAGEVPVAFVVRAEGGPDDAAIHAHMAATLSSYKQLHAIIEVDEIPKNPSGKILRRLLRDRL
ncbi:AMP-binding protein [Yoonia sp. R2331]|uniref:AMP-binding protein n=1 Tax=Yoonia sp. R2331 TaxID=3237238 RepID=UPI0034E51FE9